MTTQAVSTSTLDHIIHLTPPGSVEETTKQFKDLGFNVISGGTHSDGLTANVLVILEDGVYVELIFFTHEVSYYPPGFPEYEKRVSHPWASKQPGWIDYAFLGSGDSSADISKIINERSSKEDSGVSYLPTVSGGRLNPDGKKLEWVLNIAEIAKHGKGILPFFCGDVSPREWRVPSSPASNLEHPNSARGIAHVKILSDATSYSLLVKQFTSVLGYPPLSSTSETTTWNLHTLSPITIDSQRKPHLILNNAQTEDELAFVATQKAGIYETGFFVESGKEKQKTRTPFGSIVWVPLN